jgi:DNA-binding beta-propeller fold protein YncE
VSSYAGSGHVARIDPSTNQVVANISVGAGGDIGFGFSSIWAVDGTSSTISRIDPTTNHVLATIPTDGTAANGLAFSSGNVWVANHDEPPIIDGANVAKIDPATDQVATTILIGTSQGGPAWLISAAGSIWTFDQTTTSIVRINPTTDATTHISSPGGGSANRHFTTDGTRIWFSIPADPGRFQPAEVQKLDPATDAISTVVSSATLAHLGLSDVYGLLYDMDSLWLSGPCGAEACLLRIATASDSVTGAWSFPGSASEDSLELALAAGSLWVTEHRAVLRLNVS